jgi:hypothetical protein
MCDFKTIIKNEKKNDNTNDNSSLLDTLVGLRNYILKQKVCLENRIQRAAMGRLRLLVNMKI